MADWFSIPNTSVDPDAPVTSNLMYALRDNPIAISEGAPGAPRIVRTALKTATDTISGIIGSASLRIDLPTYCFFPDIKCSSGTNPVHVNASPAGGSSVATPGFDLLNTASGTRPYSVSFRYIVA